MSQSISTRDRAVLRVLVIEALGNALAVAAKVAIGLMTGSLAIIGDAVHSLTDVVNNAIAIVLLRIASRPPDRRHPYGHHKFETIAVFGLAMLLVLMAWEIGSRAVVADIDVPEQSALGIGLLLGVLAFNVAITIWERREARRLDSPILAADANHTLADAMTTVVVLAGWQLSTRGYAWVDRLLAFAIAVFVLYLAVRLFLRALPALTDEAALDAADVARAVAAIDGVLDVRRIRSRWLGDQVAVDMVIAVDRQLAADRAHAIADRVEAMLERRFGVRDSSIHVEPL